MGFKIQVIVKSEMQEESYTFNVLSEQDGIRLWLTDYKIKASGSKSQKWSNYGDDGTFLKRESITIPPSVASEAKEKVIKSISTIIE